MHTVCLLLASLLTTATAEEIVVTGDLTLEKNAQLRANLVIRADYVTIDGNGATLLGPGQPGKPDTFQGYGIVADGCRGVTLRNIKVKGFAAALVVSDGDHWLVEGCDFSDNYHVPEAGWGNGPRQGGLILTRVRQSVFRDNRANRVWNGLDLDQCSDNLVLDNDFSHCSNVCLKMATSTRNQILDNNLSYGLRISPGEVHARDSTCVLIESGSDDNLFRGNDITHGGDGVFIRVLNGWVSTGNTFIENDCSYANNNCFEAWSPGNTFIRNKANHGSYGFWLGGSDQTVLVGNEAAYNGMPDGFHNAPEAGFSHGGIVFVSGSSSHSKIVGNHCHHNHGAGIVFRGDVPTKGKRWRTFHWIVQQNCIENNQWGIYGLYGDWIYLANNTLRDNPKGNYFEGVTNLIQAEDDLDMALPPRAVLAAPAVATVGHRVTLDASGSRAAGDRSLRYRWDLGERICETPVVEHVFTKPGFYRVGLTVDDGVLADLAFRDFLVVGEVKSELGTEGDAGQWGSVIEGDATGKAKLVFADVRDAAVGRSALRFSPDVYPGLDVTAVFPATRDAGWDFSGCRQLAFWIKFQNPNTAGFQDAGPVVTLEGPNGRIVYTPADGRNFLRDTAESESRWMWQQVVIPLDGNGPWKREPAGNVDLERIDAIGLSFDSWEAEPFTIWLDGMTCQ
ncbi:MAG: right-handed parallel beta-helix repeat-containing protein [Pirellulales bacterium]|nr:right-handed parallel beta-helix repeat-containing protein [Pirellulales bacterium]